MELYLDPNKRHDFILLFDVTNGNPNGDPDAGNMPRIDPETNYGFVTDVALKRKIRDYAAMAYEKEIYIQSKSALNTLYYKAMKDEGLDFPEVAVGDDELLDWLADEAADVFDVDLENRKVKYSHEFKKNSDIIENLKEKIDIPDKLDSKVVQLSKDLVAAQKNIKKLTPKDRDAIKEALVKQYYDIRMFGAVLTAGTNAGQVRGPVQLTFARSISPIMPIDVSITRIAITREADKKKKQTEMGRKAIIPYGLYRAHGFYNPKLAEKVCSDGNPVSEEDLKILWDALQNMFEYDRSASRGEMVCRGLYIFTHNDEKGLGAAPAHKLFERLIIKQVDKNSPPRSFQDYEVIMNKDNWPEKIVLKEVL